MNIPTTFIHKRIFLFCCLTWLLSSCQTKNPAAPNSKLVHKSNAFVYIGEQCWMAQNLHKGQFANGDSIPLVTSNEAWQEAARQKKPACCYYNNDSSLNHIYGKLYNWYAVTDPRGIAPNGWHVPSKKEWNELISTLQLQTQDSTTGVGRTMKSQLYWDSDGNGTDSSGFTGLAGGYRDEIGNFNSQHYVGYWWSSTEDGAHNPICFFLYGRGSHLLNDIGGKEEGFSIRCLKNQ